MTTMRSVEANTRIHKDRLAQLTGLSERRLRQLATEGVFPKAEEGYYDLAKSIAGLFRFYREISQRLPVFDSIDQCANATGIPRARIKVAKQAGCEAFVSTRIRLEPLLRWLFSAATDEARKAGAAVEEFRRKKVQEEARLLELERLEKEQAVVATEDVKRWASEMAYAVKTEILSIPGKLAPQVVGLTPAEAEIRLREVIVESLNHLSHGKWASE